MQGTLGTSNPQSCRVRPPQTPHWGPRLDFQSLISECPSPNTRPLTSPAHRLFYGLPSSQPRAAQHRRLPPTP